MKKHMIIGAAFALIASVVLAGVDTNLTTRGVRDPVKLRDSLNANFAYLNDGVGTGSVERLATCVTNATLTAAAPVTNVTGLAAFATNILAVQVVHTLHYTDTNAAAAVYTWTTTTYSVQTTTPAIQRGAAPSLTLQR